eukprot:TRINITY_DN7300_c0_g1_i2.p1 TRINITY_DN7300_c0_g1~~TRINITY_DN7300_c0_g1_i2.p1  ORF type:complete len:320 (+),score=78.38 TRINITY_DN7300_c0_g1_i2:155-1114(+)
MRLVPNVEAIVASLFLGGYVAVGLHSPTKTAGDDDDGIDPLDVSGTSYAVGSDDDASMFDGALNDEGGDVADPIDSDTSDLLAGSSGANDEQELETFQGDVTIPDMSSEGLLGQGESGALDSQLMSDRPERIDGEVDQLLAHASALDQAAAQNVRMEHVSANTKAMLRYKKEARKAKTLMKKLLGRVKRLEERTKATPNESISDGLFEVEGKKVKPETRLNEELAKLTMNVNDQELKLGKMENQQQRMPSEVDMTPEEASLDADESDDNSEHKDKASTKADGSEARTQHKNKAAVKATGLLNDIASTNAAEAGTKKRNK